MATRPKVWAMEGRWSSRVNDVRTVKPVLEALQQAGQAKHTLQPLNRPEDLRDSLRQWAQKGHAAYRIGYLALHGSPGTVHIGRRAIDLAELGAQLPPRALAGKILHFGSCEVLRLPTWKQQDLRRSLEVRALTGFTGAVDWFPSMAFELLLLEAMTRYSRPDAIERYLLREHRAFAKQLGFVMVRG